MKKMVVLLVTLILLVGCMEKELVDSVSGEINGLVVDSSNNPVEGATISVAKYTAVSDSIGFFRISDLNVSGDPTYQLRVTKENYSTTLQDVPFDSEIDISGSSDTVTLNNAVASVTITLDELINLSGTLVLPSGRTIGSNDTLTISADLTFNSEYSGTIDASSLTGSINSDLEFSLENMPRYNGGSSSEAIDELKIKIYVNGSDNATYEYSLENLDITDYPISKKASSNIIELKDCYLKGLYSVSGSVYTDISQLSEDEADRDVVENAIVVLNLDGEEIARTSTDSDGKYIFNEISPNDDYELSLLALDTDNDGKYEYSDKEDFSSFDIADSDTCDKTTNLWYEGLGEYSITGTLYTGNKEDIAVENGIVGLYSAGGLIESRITDSNGDFEFTEISLKEVYLIAEDLDSDSNGYVNFYGYSEDDNNNLNTRQSFTNTSFVDIADVELYMKVNTDEPNYVFELEETNFFSVNSSGNVYNQSTLGTTADITLTFSEELSQETLDDITDRNADIVTLTEVSSGDGVAITVTLDGSDAHTLNVNPDANLATGDYELRVNSELNSDIGYLYGVENSIDSDILEAVTLVIE